MEGTICTRRCVCGAVSFRSTLVGGAPKLGKELSKITTIKTHLPPRCSSQKRPNAYLFAQVETNQPGVLGISSGLLVLAAPLRCAKCCVGARCPPQQAAELQRVYGSSQRRGEGQLGEWRCRKMPGSAEWRVYYPRRAVDFEKVGPSEVGLDPR
jgi:hypothetical protein